MGQTVHTLVNWTKIVYKQFFFKEEFIMDTDSRRNNSLVRRREGESLRILIIDGNQTTLRTCEGKVTKTGLFLKINF